MNNTTAQTGSSNTQTGSSQSDATIANREATVADRSQEFLPVEGSQETASAGGLLVAAYVVMWALVFAFIWLTSRRLTGMSGRIEQLESALRSADKTAAAGSSHGRTGAEASL